MKTSLKRSNRIKTPTAATKKHPDGPSGTILGTSRRPVPSKTDGPLSEDMLRKIHGWWRAANYLSVGQT